MSLFRKLLLIMGVVVTFINTTAQVTVFELSEPRKQKLETSENDQVSDRNTRFIISEIAKAIPKSPDVTSFSIDFESMIRLKVIDSLQYNIFCELKAMQFSGDIMYRNMNISHLLVPDHVNFGITVYCSKNMKQQRVSRTFQNISMVNNMGYFTILQDDFRDSTSHCEYTASLDQINLSYSDHATEIFSSGIALINEYYRADRKIDELFATTRQIDINRLDRVSFNSIVLREVEQDYQKLMDYDFFNTLNLWLSDPVNFSGRTAELGRIIENLRFQINEKLRELDRLYYEFGLQAMHEEKFDSAKYYFSKAAEYNYAFVPALIEMAYLDYLKGSSDSAAIRILNILDNTIPSVQDIVRLDEVSSLTIGLITDQVRRRHSSQDYVEAQYLLEFALQICQRSTHLNCLNTMEQLMAQTKYGLYKSLLTVVEKAVESKRFEIAWQYLRNAITYQQQNNEYIISPIETEKYYNILLTSCIREIDLSNRESLFLKSQELILWLESLCDTVPQFDCSALHDFKTVMLFGLYNERLDKIEQDILKKNYQAAETRIKLLSDFIRINPELTVNERYNKADIEIYTFYYHSAIAEAVSNIEYGFYEPAWNHLINAVKIQENHKLSKYQNIDSLFQMVSETVFSKKFRSLISHNSAYTISSLSHKSEELNSIIEKSGVILSDSLDILRNALNGIINGRICDSISDFIYDNFNLAARLTEEHKFISADSLYSEMSGLCNNKNIQCNCQTEKIEEQRKKIQPGIEWEKQCKEINILAEKDQWEDVINLYPEYKEICSNQNNYMWGVKCIPLEEFILQYNDTAFIQVGFDYFYEHREYDKAFQMLNALRKLDFPVILTIEMQKKAGIKLAVRDKILNHHANYKVNILKYTEGEEYFLYFSKSYRKMWKKY